MSPLRRLPLAIIDVLLLSIIVPFVASWFVARMLWTRRVEPKGRRMMVIDTSYSLYTIRTRGQERAILCRDLHGYFQHVTTVHPLAGADPNDPEDTRIGSIRTVHLNDSHTVIECPVHQNDWSRFTKFSSFVLNQWKLLRYLRNYICRQGISLIRIGDPFYQGLIGLFLARTRKIPLVIRIGGNLDAVYAQTGQLAYPRILPSRRIELAVARFVLKRADLVVGANRDNLESALRHGATRSKTEVFRYGNLVADEHFVDPSKREPVTDIPQLKISSPLLAFVGRLEAVKHVDDLPVIMAKVLQKEPRAKLLVIGDGSRRSAMAAKAKEEGIEDAILFVGNRNQGWIASVMSMVDVIVSPHMGRALVETALGAAPVVGYDHDWQAEFIEEGVHGHLVPLGDVEAMAVRVVELIQNPVKAKQMGRSLREKAYQMMDPAKLTDHERRTYERFFYQQTPKPAGRSETASV